MACQPEGAAAAISSTFTLRLSYVTSSMHIDTQSNGAAMARNICTAPDATTFHMQCARCALQFNLGRHPASCNAVTPHAFWLCCMQHYPALAYSVQADSVEYVHGRVIPSRPQQRQGCSCQTQATPTPSP